MGLFNHLFGDSSEIAREASYDAETRIRLWEEHLRNYQERSNLSKFFKFDEVDNALANPPNLYAVLEKIESLISRDLVNIGDETKTENEILGDIDVLQNEWKKPGKKFSLSSTSIVERHQAVKYMLNRLYRILMVELHALRHLKTKPTRELLLKLFKILFHDEDFINCEYRRIDTKVLKDLNNLTRAVLLEEKVTEEMQSAEDTFVKNAVKHMRMDSKHAYRRLAERVQDDILEIAGVPFRDQDDWERGFPILERSLEDRGSLRKLIIKNKGRIKLTDEKVEWLVSAFIEAYNDDNFPADLY